MKRCICLLLILATISGLAVLAEASDGIVSLYTVNGSRTATSVQAGHPVRFVIRYTNNTGAKCDVSTGFRLQSPDGATWDSTTFDSVGPFTNGEWDFGKHFSIVYSLQSFSADGELADTVGFIAAGLGFRALEQLPIGFDDSVLAITAVFSNQSAVGKHICIDSSFYRPGGTWTWVDKNLNNYYPQWLGLDASQSYTPDFGYCFQILGDTIVNPGHTKRVPADYGTIQAAIDAAEDGDTVLVAAGSYAENLNFKGKSFKLISESGAAATTLTAMSPKAAVRPQVVIDTINSGKTGDYYRQLFAATAALPVITIPAGSNSTTVIDGFTIDGGYSVQGITCLESNPLIQHCIIQNCAGYWDGGGLWIQKCRPTIRSNIIRNNTTPVTGGGIFLHLKDSSGIAHIYDNEFRDNTALNGAGIGIIYGRGARVTHNVLVNNDCPDISTRGGALYCGVSDSVFFINNTVVDCSFGITMLTARFCDARNNLVARCNMNAFEQRIDVGPNTGLTFDYNLIWAATGTDYYASSPGLHDINVDPMIDASMKLLPGSPCIDAGDPSILYNDPDGSRNDIGALPSGGGTQPPSDTLHVPSERATIQEAINDIADGGVILVSPGTYTGGLIIEGKAVKIKSTRGPDVTTITASNVIDLVKFSGPAATPSLLEGFTLLGGHIGVYCLGSGPTIRRNVLAYQNASDWAAIAIAGGDAPAVIVNNTIVHCANGGISTFSITAPVFRNNIIAFNGHYGVHVQDVGLPLIAEYNNIYGNPEPYYNWPSSAHATMLSDPLLDASYHLMAGSPCINAGDPDPAYNDLDGTRNDMGAISFTGSVESDPIPTNEWIIVYCEHAMFDIIPMPQGSILRAYDPQGICCGKTVIDTGGKLGPMLIYRDDPYTTADEGAVPGDRITFRLYSIFRPTNTEVIPAEPVIWSQNGALQSVCQFQYGLCQTIQLHTGWNLVSWNVAFDRPIEELISGHSDCIDLILGFDRGGLVYIPTMPQFSTLNTVDHHFGYWIKARCDFALTLCGTDIMCSDDIPINSGWNLVSYLEAGETQTQVTLNPISDVLQVALGYDNGAKVFVPNQPNFNTLTTLKPGFGYWLRSSAATTLPVRPCIDVAKSRLTPVAASTTPSLGSRNWMSVYGSRITLNGVAIAKGATVEFVTSDNVVVGRSTYGDGLLKFTPVYGSDDQDATTRYFPKDGDQVFAVIDGIRTAPAITWSGHGSLQKLTGLTTTGGNVPREYGLSQNYPNPFNPQTTIAFALPEAGHVRIVIYNVLGQSIKTLADVDYAAGNYKLIWDGTDASGSSVASGVYLYRLEANNYRSSKKMLLLK